MDAMTLVVLLVFMLVAAVTFAVGALVLRFLPGIRAGRIAAAPSAPGDGRVSILRWEEQVASGWRRVVERLGRPLAPRDVALLGWYRRRLGRAGFYDPRAVTFFLGAKIAVGVVAACSYALYGVVVQRALPNLLSSSALLAAVGFLMPDAWLRLKAAQREQAINNALPDVLDLMMICVEAGMGFDAAVARITEQPEAQRSPLHQELRRMHLEARAGRPREEALRALADRVGTQDLKSAVTAFIQTERLGTSLGRTLRVQAEASRVKRRHRAETKAQIAPLLMLVPTVVFILPAFMMVAMAPAMLRVLELMQGGWAAGR